jgi:hypothetical protein
MIMLTAFMLLLFWISAIADGNRKRRFLEEKERQENRHGGLHSRKGRPY